MHPPDGWPSRAAGAHGPPAGAQRPPPDRIVFAIGPVVRRADIPVLCERLAALLRHSPAVAVACDASAVAAPDAGTVEALARLRLTAQRHGCRFRVSRAGHRLRELIALTGLTEILLVEVPLAGDASVVEVRGEPEEGEQALGVQERVERPDPTG